MVATCGRIVGSTRFEYLTIAVIVLNAVVLGLDTYPRIAAEAHDTLVIVNDVCLGYFVVELTIRITAHGSRPQNFFRNGWNVFDFVVVGAAFVPGVRENATLLRVVRLLRVFRIISVLPEMRVLVQGLVRSFAPLASVGLLTFLLFYVYGMIGWLAFADQDPRHWDTITQAMLTLFSVLTLEEWVAIQDTVIGDSPWAWIYFVSFVLLSAFLLLNMVIAVVINSVEDARELVKEEERKRELAELARETSYQAQVLTQLASLREVIDGLEQELHAERDQPPEGSSGG